MKQGFKKSISKNPLFRITLEYKKSSLNAEHWIGEA